MFYINSLYCVCLPLLAYAVGEIGCFYDKYVDRLHAYKGSCDMIILLKKKLLLFIDLSRLGAMASAFHQKLKVTNLSLGISLSNKLGGRATYHNLS